MRLHQVKVFNITSLKGEHIINLDKELGNEDLFAITGPTGSGKSSILTAISLALFNKNYKSTLNASDFVTLGEPEAYSELLFSVAGKLYTASWRCRVSKKSGELLKKPLINHELFHDNKALEIRAEEVIGLNFEQFCKTVILNQGEFSRFLISSFRERKDILERLYDGEQLSILSKILKNKIKDLIHQIEKKQIRLDSDLPYTESEIEALKKEIPIIENEWSTFQNQEKSLTQIGLNLRDCLSLLEKGSELSKKSKNTSEELGHVIKDLNSKKSIQKEYEENFNKVNSDYKNLSPLLTKAISLNEELSFIKDELSQSKNKLNELEKERELSKEKIKEFQTEIKNKNEIKNDLIKSSNLSNLTSDIFLICEEYILSGKKLQKNIETYKQTNSISAERIESINQKTTLQNNALKEYELKASKIPYELDNLDIKKSKAIQEKDHLMNEWIKMNPLFDQYNELNQAISLYDEKDSIFQKSLKNLTENIILKKEQYNLALKKSELADLIKAQHLCSKESEKQGECVICKTPWDNSQDLETINDTEDLTEENNKLEKELYKLDKEKDLTVLKIDELKKEHVSNSSSLSEVKLKLSNLFKSLNLTSVYDKEASYQHIQKKRDELDKKRTKYEEYEKDLISLNALIKKSTNEINELTIEKKSLQNHFEVSLETLKLDQEKLMDLVNKIKELIPHYDNDFNKLLEKFDNDQKQWNILKELKATIKGLEGQFEITYKQEKSLSNQLTTILDNIQIRENRISKLENEINELCPNKNPKSELQLLESQLEETKQSFEKSRALTNQVEKKKENIEGHLNSLNDQIKDINLAKINDLTNLKSSVKEYLSSNEINSSLFDDGFKRAIEKLAEINLETESSLLKDILSHFKSSLHEYQDEFLKKMTICRDKLTNFKERVRLFEETQKKREETRLLLEELLTKQERLKSLESVIGKDEFRNFVLGLVEEQLITQTNSELNSLCDGRYELIQQEATRGHDFYIIDRWGGGLQRKVSTLSGGETFLVSLAMALSLAEMTRGRAEIDSFFIDEGFGSLDKDSIDEVLEVLMSVRNRGKQIGVISHIKGLTDRIPININLHKSNLGHSQLSMSYN